MTSVILFFYPETVWEGLLSFMVCKLGTFCRNSRNNLLCQDPGVSHWSFLLEVPTSLLYEQLHENPDGPMFWLICKCLTEVALCVLYNYIWSKRFPKRSFALKTYITTVEICFIWWICFCYQLPGYYLLYSRGNNFFHHPIIISNICLSLSHSSVSGIAPMFPFRVIKSQVLQCSLILWSRTAASCKANRFSWDVNRLPPQQLINVRKKQGLVSGAAKHCKVPLMSPVNRGNQRPGIHYCLWEIMTTK